MKRPKLYPFALYEPTRVGQRWTAWLCLKRGSIEFGQCLRVGSAGSRAEALKLAREALAAMIGGSK